MSDFGARSAAAIALSMSVLVAADGALAQSPDPTASAPSAAPTVRPAGDLLMPDLPASSADAPAAPPAPSIVAPSSSATSLADYMARRRVERKASGEKPSPPLDLDIDPEAMRTARGFGIAGGHLFFWPYLLSLVTGVGIAGCDSCGRDHRVYGFLAIPVIGPFIPVAAAKTITDTGKGVLIADGVLQSVGALCVFGALLGAPKTHPKKKGAVAGLTWQVAPIASPEVGGLRITGSF